MEQKWVTLILGQGLYAFELEHVQEMVRMPECRSVPRMPADHIGVTMLRNKIIPVVDLAGTFGLVGADAYGRNLANILRERRQDHINWLNELESSIRENREFTLTLDPTKCKFGVWYATFQSNDPWLSTLLRNMDRPHRQIHGLGKIARDLLASGNAARACELVEEHRNTYLRELLDLFDQTIQQAEEASRRILIVLRGRSGPLGVAVDGLHSVSTIADSEIQSPDNLPGHEYDEGLIGFWVNKQIGQTVRLLDPVSLYPQLAAVAS